MGNIVSTKRADQQTGEVLVELLLSQEEVKQLKGEMNDVHLFSERVADVPSRVSLRGRNEATKYFLIPRQLRKKLSITGSVSCQRLEKEGKSIFIYVIDPVAGGRESFVM